jgi:hypothetical protein
MQLGRSAGVVAVDRPPDGDALSLRYQAHSPRIPGPPSRTDRNRSQEKLPGAYPLCVRSPPTRLRIG